MFKYILLFLISFSVLKAESPLEGRWNLLTDNEKAQVAEELRVYDTIPVQDQDKFLFKSQFLGPLLGKNASPKDVAPLIKQWRTDNYQKAVSDLDGNIAKSRGRIENDMEEMRRSEVRARLTREAQAEIQKINKDIDAKSWALSSLEGKSDPGSLARSRDLIRQIDVLLQQRADLKQYVMKEESRVRAQAIDLQNRARSPGQRG